ncbi:MAG: site-specific DNA-methyltransferase [Alphaproteobacteria bacterium]|nr:site-specific DNA-methyltransferase [Alphaproteobacteria bacterium]MDA8029826.1 site-specific DNA-methyltransferase [Alphaproteobacteria bacterium]
MTIHNEDCLATMERMEPGSVDMILTSPPYDDIRDYKGYSFDFEGVAAGMLRILKEGGVGVWVVADRIKDFDESGTSFTQGLYFQKIGFKRRTMIYEKSYPPNIGDPEFYGKVFEYIHVLSKGRPGTRHIIKDRPVSNAGQVVRIKKFRDKRTGKMMTAPARTDADGNRLRIPPFGRRFDVWRYNLKQANVQTDKIAFNHPAIMPEPLAEDMVRTWSDPGDLVYDPFMGSGTTAKAAIRLGRRWVGSEISPAYCDLIRKRMGPPSLPEGQETLA